MYRSVNMWEDCLRVAKANGNKAENNELARGWVNSLPKEQQIEKLISIGLTEAAIDIYIQNKDFDNAFKLAEKSEKYKIPEIHLKYTYELETEKSYHEAEVLEQLKILKFKLELLKGLCMHWKYLY